MVYLIFYELFNINLYLKKISSYKNYIYQIFCNFLVISLNLKKIYKNVAFIFNKMGLDFL